MKKEDTLKIPKRNDFTLLVPLSGRVSTDEPNVEPINDVAETTTEVTVITSNGKRITVPAAATVSESHALKWYVADTDDGKSVAIFFPFNIQHVDKYGLVIIGVKDGYHWQYKANPGEAFEIVDATSEQYIPNNQLRTFVISGNASAGIMIPEKGAPGKSAYEIAVEHGYKGDEEAWLASLKGNPGTNFTYQDLTPANKRDLMSYFDLSRIYAFGDAQSEINAYFGYNRIDFEVGTLTINLPTPDDVNYLQSLIIYLFTGASPYINFSSGNIERRFTDSYLISANCRYEISCLFNGLEWIITSILID